MFEELREDWITELYLNRRGILLPSINEQLSVAGLILDLDSLPTFPVPFKELFVRWLISINRERIKKGDEVLVTREIALKCPLWKIIKPPLKKVTLTPEKLFNKPRTTTKTIGTKPPVRGINKS